MIYNPKDFYYTTVSLHAYGVPSLSGLAYSLKLVSYKMIHCPFPLKIALFQPEIAKNMSLTSKNLVFSKVKISTFGHKNYAIFGNLCYLYIDFRVTRRATHETI